MFSTTTTTTKMNAYDYPFDYESNCYINEIVVIKRSIIPSQSKEFYNLVRPTGGGGGITPTRKSL